MQFSELTAETLARMAVPTGGDGLSTSARAGAWVNTALRKLTNERDWWWNLTTLTGLVINNGVAALPTDFVHALGLSVSGFPIDQISQSEYLAQAVTADLPAPFGFVINGSQIMLAPAPSEIINDTSFIYYRTDIALSAAGDTPRMPALHHDALISYAVYHGYLDKQDNKKAAPHLLEYQSWVKSMQADVSPTKKHHIRRVGRREQFTAGTGGFTFLTAPGPYAGGIIVCTTTTHPVGVEGQVIYETDTDRLLVYDSVEVDFVVPKQFREESVWSIMTALPF